MSDPFDTLEAMLKHAIQLEFPPKGRGGRRPGVGRPRGDRITHHGRRAFRGPVPLHVSVHMAGGLPNLRRKDLFHILRRSLARRRELDEGAFRIVAWSVQSNHLHLLVEGTCQENLAHGMQCLNTSIAKRVNAFANRHGPVLRDRYWARPLKTPREVRNAHAYVIGNREHHTGYGRPDFCASPAHPETVVEPRTWLMTVGLDLAIVMAAVDSG